METKQPKKLLSADEFLSANDIEYTDVPAFKEGEFVRIKSLTAGDVIEWTEARDASPEAKRVAGLNLIVKSAVDADGNLLFNASHIDVMRRKPVRITQGIVAAILKHNGLNVKQEAAEKND